MRIIINISVISAVTLYVTGKISKISNKITVRVNDS